MSDHVIINTQVGGPELGPVPVEYVIAWPPPPAFYANIESYTVQFNDLALVEHTRMTARDSTFQFPPRPAALAPARADKDLVRHSQGGGPDLSDLRGYPAPTGPQGAGGEGAEAAHKPPSTTSSATITAAHKPPSTTSSATITAATAAGAGKPDQAAARPTVVGGSSSGNCALQTLAPPVMVNSVSLLHALGSCAVRGQCTFCGVFAYTVVYRHGRLDVYEHREVRYATMAGELRHHTTLLGYFDLNPCRGACCREPGAPQAVGHGDCPPFVSSFDTARRPAGPQGIGRQLKLVQVPQPANAQGQQLANAQGQQPATTQGQQPATTQGQQHDQTQERGRPLTKTQGRGQERSRTKGRKAANPRKGGKH